MSFYGCLITVVPVASPADKDAISEQHTAFVTVPRSPGYLLWKVVKRKYSEAAHPTLPLFTITSSGPVADQTSLFSHPPRDPSLSHKTFMVSCYAFHFTFCFTQFILSFSSFWPCLGLGMCILHTTIEMSDVSVYLCVSTCAHMCVFVCAWWR